MAEAVIYGFTLLAIIPLALVLGYLLKEGAGALSWGFLTKLPPSNVFDAGGGIGNAIVGTVTMVGIATAIAAPLGILVALFISETASAPKPIRRLANGVGFFVDVLLGFPSILAGMVVYLTIVIATGGNSGLAGALALALLMFPIVVRSSDEILKLVPRGLTEASLALGAPRWRNAFSVVLPTAAPGLVTGVMLAVARAAGETAPLLFTAGFSQFYEWDATKPMAALPTRIFTDLQTNSPGSIERAWGAALVLIAMILVLSMAARLVGRRSRKPTR